MCLDNLHAATSRGGGPSTRLASISDGSIAGVRQLLRQACPDISALLAKIPPRGAGAERLAAMNGGGDSCPGLAADAFRDLHAFPRNRGYDVVRQHEVGASNPYNDVAAFTKIRRFQHRGGTGYPSTSAVSRRGSPSRRVHPGIPGRASPPGRMQGQQRCCPGSERWTPRIRKK